MTALLVVIGLCIAAGGGFVVAMLRHDRPVLGALGIGVLQVGALMSAVYGGYKNI
jgi:hypothetical protein